MDAEAWLIAQPEPVYAASLIMPSCTSICSVKSSPQLGLWPCSEAVNSLNSRLLRLS